MEEQRPAVKTDPEQPKQGTMVKAKSTARQGYQIGKLVVLVVLAVIAALFVVRNWDDVSLDYVIGDVDLPLAVVMIGCGLLGAAIGILVYWLLFRRKD